MASGKFHGLIAATIPRGTPVAVKCLQLDASEVGPGPARDFEREVAVLATRKWSDTVQAKSLLTQLELRCGSPAAPTA